MPHCGALSMLITMENIPQHDAWRKVNVMTCAWKIVHNKMHGESSTKTLLRILEP
jgi:hypothetical protein